MRRVRIALKYFTFGLLAGLLLAPRAGDETRRLALDRLGDLLKQRAGETSPGQPTTL
jgi:hypothetical protein